jgi:IclR family pca regulon transcriptional regulator
VNVALDLIEQIQLRGGEPATMSELARAIAKNTATCHTVLRMLQARGYVSQDPNTRRFTMGPELLSLGAAIARQVDVLDLAERHLSPLCAELRVPGTILRRLGNGALQVLRRIDRAADASWQLPENRPTPVPSLVSLVFLAWEGPSEVERLCRAWPLGEDIPSHLGRPSDFRAQLAGVRERGVLEFAAHLRPDELLASVTAGTIFDASARPVLALVLYRLTSAREPVYHYYGEALRAAADAVTGTIGGRPPPGYPPFRP